MFKRIIIAACALAVVGCATSGTQVLPEYQLADGTRMQDVVTIASDESGTAPVVTHTKTFKFGRQGPEMVAQASGSTPGMTSVVVGSVVGGVVGGATAGVVSHALSSGRSNGDLSCAEMPEPIRMTIQRCICEISSFNPGCENNPTPSPTPSP